MYLRVLIMCFIILLIPFTVNAADSANDFEVKVLPAEGQHSFSEGYFHMDSEPGETLSLDIRVTNKSGEPINLYVHAVDAQTADKGGIIYSLDESSKESDHIYLSDLINIPEMVTVAPGTDETVHSHLAIPASASGTLLGGIMLTSSDAPGDLSMESLNKGGSNYTFEQPGQRLVAIKLNLPSKSASGFSLGDAKFNADENHLAMKVNNGKSAVIENVQGTYTIMDKDSEMIVNGVIKPFAMAPTTKIDFPINLKGKTFEEGKYVLMVKGKADEKEFFAEEKFTVTKSQQAGVVDEPAAAVSPFNRENISRTIAIALVSLFLLLPLLLRLDKRNDKKNFLRFSGKNHM